MAHLADKKLAKVRFTMPVWVDGLGMTHLIDTTVDPDTGKPRDEGVSLTWLADERLVRVTTRLGETLVACDCSFKPQYDDRRTPAKK
jgi:hypothetical protein